MKLGIVGLPNVGKSTLFNSLTKAGAESANYPFCTIDPNVGVVPVPDFRLKLLTDLYHSEKTTPAVIEFVDIAGLVKGASKGEGLGNQFLSAKIFTFSAQPVNTMDLFFNIHKLFYQMQLCLIILQSLVAALDIIMHALTADAQLVCHFTQGVVI